MIGVIVFFKVIDWEKWKLADGVRPIAERLRSRTRHFGTDLHIEFELDGADRDALRAMCDARLDVRVNGLFPDVSVGLGRGSSSSTTPQDGYAELRCVPLGDFEWLFEHLDAIAAETRRLAAEHPTWRPFQIARRVGWPSDQVKSFLTRSGLR
jgi:hypothetical protein